MLESFKRFCLLAAWLVLLGLFGFPPASSFAQKIALSVRSVDSARVLMVWRIGGDVALEKGMRIRFEEKRTSQGFRSVLEIPAKKSGRVVIRKRTSRVLNFRARLLKQRRTVLSSSVITVIQTEDQGIIISDPLDGVGVSGGSQGTPPDIRLLEGEAFCPEEVVNQVLELINAHREGMGLVRLSNSVALSLAAKMHSLRMLRSHQLTHDGWIDAAIEAGYSPGYLAQNIASTFTDPSALVDGWLNSGGHRHNIESSTASETGISCAQDNNGTWWWTHYFGAPLN